MRRGIELRNGIGVPHRSPELSLRGGVADVAISGRQLRFRREYPVIQPGTARFPRRFAPRNDTSGWCGGAPEHFLRLNFPVQGAHYPQGARRIRKAAKPPTAAQ